jgi:4-amino-4-deoxy-L-arabinose transferase-like glycosyltransferase
MSNSTSKANWFWIALLLGLGVGGVSLLLQTQGKSISGWILLIGMLLLLWGTEIGGGAPALWTKAFEWLTPDSNGRRLALVVLAGVLAIASTVLSVLAEKQPAELLRTLSVLLWFAGGVCLTLAYLHLTLEDLQAWWQTYQREVILVALITLFAALLRFYQLGMIPDVINGDEGWTGLAALKLLPAATFIYDNPFSFFEGFGRIHLRIIRWAILLFGQNAFSLRLIPAIGGTLAIPALYLFVRYLLGVRSAWVAALLLAVAHAHIHFSRTAAVAYIQSTWLSSLELYFFLSGLEKRDRTRMIIGGLILGFHFNVYVSAQILVPLALVFILLTWFLDRPLIRENLKNIGWFFFGALLLALPSLTWAFNHPNDFAARFGKEGTFQSGWLAREVITTGKPAVLILLERFIHACLAIFVLPFQDFYWVRMPVLDFITATLFLVGVLIALRRTREPRFLLLNGWLWSGVFSLSVFAIPPASDSYRLLMVLPAMCVMAALGWDYLLGLTKRVIEAVQPAEAAPAAAPGWALWSLALVVVIAGFNLKIYYLDFGRSCQYMNNDPVARGWSLIGDYLREHRPIDQAYMLGNEVFHYGTHPSVDYMSGFMPMTNIFEPFAGVPTAHGNVVFVLSPDRLGELEMVQAFAPGGEVARVFDCGRLSFIGYEVEKK